VPTTRTPPRGLEVASGFQSWAPGVGERDLDRAERESAARRVESATPDGTIGDEARRVFASSLRALGLNAYASVLLTRRR
jgi:hypothetical protein